MARKPPNTPASSRDGPGTRQARLAATSTDYGHGSSPTEGQGDKNPTSWTASPTLSRQVTTLENGPLARAPPTYAELYPPAPAPVSRRPLKKRQSPPQGMDPLVAAMWHNENLSLLHSLPDRVLLKVIRELGNTGIECLRRVARRFPPLCVREILSPLRGNDPRLSETGPLNWPTSRVSSYFKPEFLELIDRDEYCSGCQAAWRSPCWEQRVSKLTEYVHCAACGADHPACLFSATQRLKPARLRYCIGHEGFMRVCEHTGGTVSLARLDGMALVSRSRKLRDKRERPWETVLCKDSSHIILCERKQGGAFPESKYTCGSRRGVCIGYPLPRIIVHGQQENLPGDYDIRWPAHIPFDGQMSTLRASLGRIGENCGKYIIPRSATAKEPSALRCFDPNDCHCTIYAGSENVRWEWECGPWLPGATECIGDRYKGLDALRPPTRPDSAISKMIRRLKRQPPRECAADQKAHQSRCWLMSSKRGVGFGGVDVRPCHTGKDCLKVEYMRILHPRDNDKITPQWYNTLDPESYNVTGDQDGMGVFWCRTPGCRNYYKGVLNYAGILRHREFRKECGHRDYNTAVATATIVFLPDWPRADTAVAAADAVAALGDVGLAITEDIG